MKSVIRKVHMVMSAELNNLTLCRTKIDDPIVTSNKEQVNCKYCVRIIANSK